MSDRLLSELFPIFVRKEYLLSQRLSQGPFGAGLKKGRKYLKPGEKAPEGANVQTGPQGGQYYEEMGGGGAQGYDIDYGDPERSAQVREELDQQGMGVPPAPEAGPEISEDRNVVGGIDYGPADKGTPALQDSKDYLKGTADAWAEQMTNDPAFTGSEAQIDAAVADLESEIKSQDSDLTNQAAEFDPANSHLDHSNGDIDDDGNWTAPLNEESQKLVDEFRDKLSSGGGAQSPMIPNPSGYEEGTNYTDTQVVNPDIPDTIPNPGGFETGNYTDNEIPNPAKYPSTTGPTATPDVTPDKEYDGYVGARAVEAEKKANEFIEGVGDHLMDQGTGYDPAEISDTIDGYAASRAYLPGSETYDKLQEAGQRFMAERKDESADYYGENYALMAKMIRRDPIILSNKGGNQRLSLQKAGPHKYTSRTMGPDGRYKYEYAGGVQGHPDAPDHMDSSGKAYHHAEAAQSHGMKASMAQQEAERSAMNDRVPGALRSQQPGPSAQTQGLQAQAQGHQEAQQYHNDQSATHKTAGQQERAAQQANAAPTSPESDKAWQDSMDRYGSH